MRNMKGPLQEGDVILSNHPAAGGSHLPDLTVITPVWEVVATRVLEWHVFVIVCVCMRAGVLSRYRWTGVLRGQQRSPCRHWWRCTRYVHVPLKIYHCHVTLIMSCVNMSCDIDHVVCKKKRHVTLIASCGNMSCDFMTCWQYLVPAMCICHMTYTAIFCHMSCDVTWPWLDNCVLSTRFHASTFQALVGRRHVCQILYACKRRHLSRRR